jgi:putative ABC transport system permease protein
MYHQRGIIVLGGVVDDPVLAISLPRLALAFVPALVVLAVIFKWTLNSRTALYALSRMLVQLVMIGYLLAFIFGTSHGVVVVGVLVVMMTAACWISLRPVRTKTPRLYRNAMIAIIVGGVPTLVLVTGLVLRLDPWFLPRYMIPLAGMIFAGSMNSVSLAAERFEAESQAGQPCRIAQRLSFQAALIPVINSLFAVGIVSLPGMMTGQILAGSSPLIAARYQIVVMCMLFGASGVSAAVYLALAKSQGSGARIPVSPKPATNSLERL